MQDTAELKELVKSTLQDPAELKLGLKQEFQNLVRLNQVLSEHQANLINAQIKLFNCQDKSGDHPLELTPTPALQLDEFS